MVTSTHEAHHSIFRHDEDLFPEVMEQVFGVVLGKAGRVTVLGADLTEQRPLERRADSVLLAELLVEDGASKYIVVVEAQTDPDPDKRWSWPYYIAYLRDKYKCPVLLLVVCVKPETEAWARTEITSGLGKLVCMRVRPAVCGPSSVRPVTDLETARGHVGFAVFSALTHSHSNQARDILEILAEALGSIDEKNAKFLAEFVEAGLVGTDGHEIWRELMITGNYPHVSQWRAQATEQGIEQGIEQGSVRTRIEDILRILSRRGVSLSAAERSRIEDCADQATLETWFDRSLMIDNAKDLFAD
jgi:hypothetical protein